MSLTEKTDISDSDEKVVEIEMERLRTFTNHVLYEEELIRWRQALIKYLPPEWADGLQQDIFDEWKEKRFPAVCHKRTAAEGRLSTYGYGRNPKAICEI
jgi:hypothetical protein